jgi:hypothetical protein
MDRIAIYQAKLRERRERKIKAIWIRLIATGLVRRGGKRYNELVDEASAIASREYRDIYEARRVVKPKEVKQ